MQHRYLKIPLLFLGCCAILFSQESATLSGTVVDPTDAVVPGTEVTLLEAEHGFTRRATSDPTGVFTFESVPPGDYTVGVVKNGFKRQKLEHVRLNVRDRQALRIQLQVSAAPTTSVEVVAEVATISTDISTGTAIEHGYSQNLPVNGRNAQSLVLMSPGVINAAGGPGVDDFNVNGLRSNTNYYMVDGVSANRSLSGAGGPGGGRFGGGRGFGGGSMDTVAGTSASDGMPLDSLQEVRVQTSTFAPEFGRSPGAQVSMISRGGSNQFHGALSEYLRNDDMNANDWFANSTDYARGELRQNRFGAVLGGPVISDRTFFFASYEGLRLLAPQTIITSVPDARTRKYASAALRPYLNAFPIPNGPEQSNGAAEYTAIVSNPTTSNTGSLRLDHRFNDRWNVFVRYSNLLSGGDSRGSQMTSPNVLSTRNLKSQTFTASIVTLLDMRTTNDLRLNYSQSQVQSAPVTDDFGGAVPLKTSQMFPSGITTALGQFNLNVMGVSGYSYGSASKNQQAQLNFVDSITKMAGNHHYKFGVDYRRTSPTIFRLPYTASVSFNGLSGPTNSLASGTATSAVVTSNERQVYPLYMNFSLYAQDTYRATERTTFTFGLRWDVNPAPTVRQGPRPYSLDSDMSICGVTQNEGLYHTRWFDVAPRLGLAYQMDTTPGREMVLRMGAGAFFDMGYGMSSAAFNGAPYSSVNNLTSVTFPLTAANLAAPLLPPTRPFGQVTAADVSLQSPVVFQWNVTVDRSIGRAQMFSIGYVGTSGRRLLVTQSTPSFSGAYDMLMQTTNGATSIYHGMQAQFRRRMTKDLQMQLGYTFGHAIDTGSSDMGTMGFANFTTGNKGNSDYDIRQNLNVSGSYRLPAPKMAVLRTLFGSWYADWVATARTGLSYDVQGISAATSDTVDSTSTRGGVFAQVRPDYDGLPVWIFDSHAPGGKRLNLAAFTVPTGYQQGNLGRNAIKGFPAWQLDLAIRRQIAISESWRLQIAAQAYNALNHPNFADPSRMESANLSSANFGIATRMLNQGMGGTGSVYGSGGPRTMELTLRLQF